MYRRVFDPVIFLCKAYARNIRCPRKNISNNVDMSNFKRGHRGRVEAGRRSAELEALWGEPLFLDAMWRMPHRDMQGILF